MASKGEVVADAPGHIVAPANEPQTYRVFLIAAFVAFGGFLFGYDCIIGGELIDVARFTADFGTPQPPDDELGFPHAIRGLFVSIMSVGTFFGSLSASQFADRFGRKRGILMTCLIFCAGIILQSLAANLTVLMLGRCVAGYGVGLLSVMIPLYQSECVPPSRRGTMVSCYQLAITIGLLIGQIITFGCKDITTKASYRVPISLQMLWVVILALGMILFPETPRYLIRNGQWEAAVRAKVKLTGLPQNHPLVQEELLEVLGNYQHETQDGQTSTYKECWQGTNLRRTLLGIFMQVWQQRIQFYGDI
jgi:MFS transporter, SP family, sugar:H+ symporter